MTAAMLVLEPIFEADLPPEIYAYRAGRNAQQAVVEVEELLFRGHPDVRRDGTVMRTIRRRLELTLATGTKVMRFNELAHALLARNECRAPEAHARCAASRRRPSPR